MKYLLLLVTLSLAYSFTTEDVLGELLDGAEGNRRRGVGEIHQEIDDIFPAFLFGETSDSLPDEVLRQPPPNLSEEAVSDDPESEDDLANGGFMNFFFNPFSISEMMNRLMTLPFGGGNDEFAIDAEVANVTQADDACVVEIQFKGLDTNLSSIALDVFTTGNQIAVKINSSRKLTIPTPPPSRNNRNFRMPVAAASMVTVIRTFPVPPVCDVQGDVAKATYNEEQQTLKLKFAAAPSTDHGKVKPLLNPAPDVANSGLDMARANGETVNVDAAVVPHTTTTEPTTLEGAILREALDVGLVSPSKWSRLLKSVAGMVKPMKADSAEPLVNRVVPLVANDEF